MEVVYTILGTVIGFMLSQIERYIWEKRDQGEQSKSVKTLLRLEMGLNLELLESFWPQISQANELGEDPDTQKRDLARRFITLSFPAFKREGLESQLNLLATILNEKEVTQVFQFYNRFDKLQAIRDDLIRLIDLQREEAKAATLGGAGLAYPPPTPFNAQAPELWDECKQLVAQIRAEENPL